MRNPLRSLPTLLVLFCLSVLILPSVHPVTAVTPVAQHVSDESDDTETETPPIGAEVFEPFDRQPAIDSGSDASSAPTFDQITIAQDVDGPLAVDIVAVGKTEPGNEPGTANIRAGNSILYNYTVTNNSSTSYNDVFLDITWNDFDTNLSRSTQYCDKRPGATVTPCVLTNVQSNPAGFDVRFDLDEDIPGGVRVNIVDTNGDPRAMAPNDVVQFTIELFTNPFRFPKTLEDEPENEAVFQLAGSAEVFANGNPTRISSRTVSGLIVGPIFRLLKRVADGEPDIVYAYSPGEPGDAQRQQGAEVTFEIIVGNRSYRNPGGVDDAGREDGRDATNVIVTDDIPLGTEPVIPPNYDDLLPPGVDYDEVNSDENMLVWNIASLPLDQEVTIPVTYRKLDSNAGGKCRLIENILYTVTSDEMPRDDEDNQLTYFKRSNSPRVDVQVPIRIRGISANPSEVAPGELTAVTVVLESRYTQAINDLKLRYQIQAGAEFINEGDNLANPSPESVNAGEVVWDLDFPAADSITGGFKERTVVFYLRLNTPAGDQRGVFLLDTASATPIGIPTACIDPGEFEAKIQKTQIDILHESLYGDQVGTNENNPVLVEDQGEIVDFRITITNSGPEAVGGSDLIDLQSVFPPFDESTFFANIKYVDNSAQSLPPGTPLPTPPQGNDQFLDWRDISIDAGQTVVLTYKATVNGSEFVPMCMEIPERPRLDNNRFNVSLPNNGKACVRINPEITLTKTSDKATVSPSDQVRFTVSVQNNSSNTYEIGVADWLRDFQFVELDLTQTNNYTTTGELRQINNIDTWVGALVSLPPGGVITLNLIGSVPGESPQDLCERNDYFNEALFYFRTPRTDVVVEPYLVRQIPPVEIRLPCGSQNLEYSLRGPETSSLGTAFLYEVELENLNDQPLNNVKAEVILPPGFGYDGPSSNSDVTERPDIDLTSRSDGRTILTWDVDGLPVDDTYEINFFARSGGVVGQRTAWLYGSVDDRPGVCRANCQLISEPIEGSEEELVRNYSTSTMTVDALATIEPRIFGLPLDGSCLDLDPTQPAVLDYEITLLSTTDEITYRDIELIATLPIGVTYSEAVGDTPQPKLRRDSESGQTQVFWERLVLPAAPRDGIEQQKYRIRVQIEGFVPSVPILVSATSPDGALPLKDLEEVPVITTCLSQPLVSISVSPTKAANGEEVTYQVLLANPGGTQLQGDVEATLPAGVTFKEMLAGSGGVTSTFQLAATSYYNTDPLISTDGQNRQKLSWENVTMPAGSEEDPSFVLIRFIATVGSEMNLGMYQATATVSSSTQTFDNRFGSADLEVTETSIFDPDALNVYLPLVRD